MGEAFGRLAAAIDAGRLTVNQGKAVADILERRLRILEASEADIKAVQERFPSTYFECLDFDFDRHSDLMPDWHLPRKFLDYWPCAAELADLRPESETTSTWGHAP